MNHIWKEVGQSKRVSFDNTYIVDMQCVNCGTELTVFQNEIEWLDEILLNGGIASCSIVLANKVIDS